MADTALVPISLDLYLRLIKAKKCYALSSFDSLITFLLNRYEENAMGTTKRKIEAHMQAQAEEDLERMRDVTISMSGEMERTLMEMAKQEESNVSTVAVFLMETALLVLAYNEILERGAGLNR